MSRDLPIILIHNIQQPRKCTRLNFSIEQQKAVLSTLISLIEKGKLPEHMV